LGQPKQARAFTDELDARDPDTELEYRDFEDLLEFYERELEVNELD
jgi:hypothetical protein